MPLSIWVYGIGYREGVDFESHWETLQWLREHGFRTNPFAERFESIEDVAAACRDWERRRAELDYEIDGIVIKVDSIAQQRELGALHERPRWARAFKWAPMTATTRLNKIMIRVGRTGALNPWAMLEPVEVGGVTVSRATLHNEEDINRKDIREGDDVIVQRAGDVIPQIVGPAGKHRRGTKPFKMPTHCPLCGAEIVKPEGEAMHRCPNRACPSRGLETLINWVQGPADIEGVGEETIRRLWAAGLVRSLPDLYRLTKEQLLELDGFGEISATNAIDGDPAVEGAGAVLARAPRPEHPRRRLGDRAQRRALTSASSTGCSTRRRRTCRRSRGSAPTAPSRSSNGSPTSRTARSSPSCASSACASRPARTSGRRRGRSPARRTSSRARSSRCRASRRGAALEELGAKVGDSVSKKTTGARRRRGAGQLEADEGAEGRHADPDEADLLKLLGR